MERQRERETQEAETETEAEAEIEIDRDRDTHAHARTDRDGEREEPVVVVVVVIGGGGGGGGAAAAAAAAAVVAGSGVSSVPSSLSPCASSISSWCGPGFVCWFVVLAWFSFFVPCRCPRVSACPRPCVCRCLSLSLVSLLLFLPVSRCVSSANATLPLVVCCGALGLALALGTGCKICVVASRER